MAPAYFLKIDGIPGESLHPEHTDELELGSFTWGETAVPPAAPVEVGFTARVSRASPELFAACAGGRRIASVLLTARETAGAGSGVRRWRFSDVVVSAYQSAASAGEPVDHVTLSAVSVEVLPVRPRAPLRFEIVRPDDLLNLEIEAINLRLDSDDPAEPALVVDDPARPARLIVTFPPQTIAETAYFRSSPETPPKLLAGERVLDLPGDVGPGRDSVARIANPSRLVFDVPERVRVPLSIEGLISWSELELVVSPIAAIRPHPDDRTIASAPAIRPPEPMETALELPYRLVVSPHSGVTWLHRQAPFTSRGRTELWHTRLALPAEDGAGELPRDDPVPLRAIWSPDYDPAAPPARTKRDPNLDLTAMSPSHRHQIVILTSAFHGYEYEVDLSHLPFLPFFEGAAQLASRARFPLRRAFPYVPEPFEAELLMLSPLGAWLRSRGHWTPPYRVLRRFPFQPNIDRILALARAPALERTAHAVDVGELSTALLGPFGEEGESLTLSEWVHVAAQGRDHYVRIVEEGELKPFGNRAAVITVTERKFVELENTTIGAYLFQRMFIVVREPEKRFADDERAMPLKRVRLTTLVTPDIAQPVPISGTDFSFWVEVNAGGVPAPFMFHGAAQDIAENDVDFTIPMMFVSLGDARDDEKLEKAVDAYNASGSKEELAHRELHIPGQQLAFAERDEAEPGRRTTELVTERVNLVVDPKTNKPRLLKADVRIPQVEELLGTNAPTTIRLYQPYVDGVDNATGVFAEIAEPDFAALTANPLTGMVENTLAVEFTSDKAGGFATPNLGVSTLSRALGPLAGDAKDAAAGTFDPTSFFPKDLALLFGSFDLGQLLVGNDLEQNAPKLRTTTAAGKVRTTIEWSPAVATKDLVVVKFEKDQGGTTKLEVTGFIEKPIGSSTEPSFEFKGTLNAFRISVLKSVDVNFDTFTFISRSGQKPDVDVRLQDDPIQFGGDLAFVEELRDAIPPGLFGDGPSLDVTANGIRAGFAFDLPPVAVGVFALKDVSLGAALTLPFTDGKPVFDFNVSTREHPFVLAVTIFGGGGFFHLQLDTSGMKELEAAFEFGVTAAIDLGVAGGSVHMMAGIYFSLKQVEPDDELAARLGGYLRMGGSLRVLALVTVSVEFNLSFTYDTASGKAYGRATLTVEVDVTLFSVSVELTVERAFGGESGDPSFKDSFTSAPVWKKYAEAFA